MRITVAIFFLLSITQLYAQTCNQVDASGKKQGVWKKNFDDGKPRYEGAFKDDIPVGVFKYYYPETSEINSVNEFYDKGLKTKAKMYHKNGKLMAEGIYVNQKKDSIWKYYNPKEVLISEEIYKNQNAEGTWIKYYENGKKLEEITWSAGVENGPVTEYYDNDTIKYKGTFVNGKLDGAVSMFYKDGKKMLEGTYKNNFREGVWNLYNDKGIIESKEYFKNGNSIKKETINGIVTDYFPDNIPKSETTYKNGKKEGLYKEYHEGAKYIRRIKTEANPETGTPAEREEVLEGHKIKIKGNYLNDKMHGKFIYYKQDGSVEKTESWNMGAKNEQ